MDTVGSDRIPGSRITVAIPTRDRPDDLRRCLQSLLAVTYPQWDILVVDQSDSLQTRELINEFSASLPRIRYFRTAERGLSRARNFAIQRCSADILAFLDDDCTVETDWLLDVGKAFVRHPDAGIVLGSVHAIPHDPSADFVPTTLVARETVFTGPLSVVHLHRAGENARVMGAAMYLRCDAIREMGLFDEYVGPGVRFGIADDMDYTYRALRCGFEVVMTPDINVLHYGARKYQDGSASRMFHTVGFAMGAVDMKLLRCGEWPALFIIPAHALEFLSWIRLSSLISRSQPTGLGWITWYLRGLIASFEMRVDRTRLLYASNVDQDTGSYAGAQTKA